MSRKKGVDLSGGDTLTWFLLAGVGGFAAYRGWQEYQERHHIKATNTATTGTPATTGTATSGTVTTGTPATTGTSTSGTATTPPVTLPVVQPGTAAKVAADAAQPVTGSVGVTAPLVLSNLFPGSVLGLLRGGGVGPRTYRPDTSGPQQPVVSLGANMAAALRAERL